MENLKKAMIIRNGNVVGAIGDKNFSTCPLGTVLSFAGQTAPRGYLLCDGASYAVAEYPDLYAVIGNTYGGDTENFNVPDYRETVLVGVGENTTDTIADHDVYELGEFKDDQFQGHWHDLGNSNGTVTVALGASAKGGSVTGAGVSAENRYTVDTALDAITDGTNGEPRTGTTTHGKQKGVTYIIKAFHTNEGVDSGVSDDVVEYVEGEIDALISDEVSDSTVWSSKKTSEKIAEHSLPLVYTTGNYTNDTVRVFKLANVIKDYTKAGFDNLNLLLSTRRGDEVELITGSDDNSNFVQAYRRSNSASKISAIYKDGYDIYVRIELYVNFFRVYHKSGNLYSTFEVTQVDSVPDTATEVSIRPLPTYINDSSTGDSTSTWSSSKIAEYVAENAAPTYSGTVIPTSIANGATVTTDWNIQSAGSNADYGRLLMLNSSAGTFLIYVKGNLGSTSTVPTPTVISSIVNSQSASWSSSFELSISGSKLRIKNKSGAVASWRFV